MKMVQEQGTLRRLVAAISADDWLRMEDIADAARVSQNYARLQMKLLIKAGQVEVAEFPGTGFVHLRYRGLADGLLAAMFSSPNVSTRPLAECWGGYSYVTKEQRAWHQ